MLGKQLWRLATKPNNLVSRVYKTKYFADSNIFHSNLGHNSNFVWRSLLETKQLLLDDMRWRVGDGSNIQILDQS